MLRRLISAAALVLVAASAWAGNISMGVGAGDCSPYAVKTVTYGAAPSCLTASPTATSTSTATATATATPTVTPTSTPTPTTDGSKANTTLNNLGSVAINAALSTGAGTTFAGSSTAPAQAASSQAGQPLTLAASNAVVGSSNAGAAAGGAVTITSGDAARLTSGNADGGDITIALGAGIGTGKRGRMLFPDATGRGSICNASQATTCLDFNSGANELRFYEAGTATVAFGTNYGVSVANGRGFGILTGAMGNVGDIFLWRVGTNRFGITTNPADSSTRGDLVLRHLGGGPTAPTVTAGCGTSPSLSSASNDLHGNINVGTGGVATTCTITFATARTNAPDCIATNVTAGNAQIVATSTTTMQVTNPGGAYTASDHVVYHCLGY